MQTSWANKFDHPTKKALLAELGKERASLFEKAYRALTEGCNSKPKLTWMDLPWNWCFVYPCCEQGLIETIYLVPDPHTPRIAATIRAAFFEKHPLETLPKPLHAGIASGVLVNHQTWCQWDLASKELLDAISEIIAIAVNT